MSLIIHILCKSKEPITPTEVVDLFHETRLLPDLKTDPVTYGGTFPETGINIIYANRKRPFTIYRLNKIPSKQYIKEVIEDLNDSNVSLPNKITKWLDTVEQVIDIDFDPKAPETVWTAIEEVEGYLANKYKGLIYVPGEGFYDDELNLLVSSKD